MPYHVAITPKSDRSHDEIRLDLSEAELTERFIDPYREGKPIVIGGKTITPDDIERLKIHFTEETSAQLLPILRAEREASNVISLIAGKTLRIDSLLPLQGLGFMIDQRLKGHALKAAVWSSWFMGVIEQLAMPCSASCAPL